MPIASLAEGEALRAPEHWRWHTRPVYGGYRGDAFNPDHYRWGTLVFTPNDTVVQPELVERACKALYAWAIEHHINVQMADRRDFGTDERVYPPFSQNCRTGIPAWFYRSMLARPRAENRRIDLITLGATQAENPGALYDEGDPVRLYCDNCGVSGLPLIEVEGGKVCWMCRSTCSWCDAFIVVGLEGCIQHGGALVQCDGCGRLSAEPLLYVRGEHRYCEHCSLRVCMDCERVFPDGELVRYADPFDNTRVNLCPPCAEVRRRRPDDRIEEFDEAAEPTVAGLKLEHTDFRPVRLCSIEMETADGGINLAPLLHQARLSTYNARVEYHRGGGGGFCYVERDASLGQTGGELIFDRIRLDDEADLEKLTQALAIVRREVKEGRVRMDMRCGLHIHVDAHQFGIHHVRNLALIFNYLEDPLYRLSAARYMRHRGTQYATKLHKGPYPDARAFGLHFLGNNGHASALNVATNYWAAVRNSCRCGASVVGKYEECECNLGKCTFEFRIYNGTVNPRKVHAYAALSQSMVSYARGMDNLDAANFPPSDFNANAPVNKEMKDLWMERLTWLFTDLYFAQPERESLMYVIRNCQLKELGKERLAEIEATEYRPPKAIRKQVIQHRNLRGSNGAPPAQRPRRLGDAPFDPARVLWEPELRPLRFNDPPPPEEIDDDEEPF